jgi:hypothetical protein
LLGVEFGGGAEESWVKGLVGEASFDVGEGFVGGFLGGDLSVLLFESSGFDFILEDIAVGTGTVLEFLIILAEGAASGDVFEGLLDGGVGGERGSEVDEDGFAAGDLAGFGEGFGESEGGGAVGGIFEDDFEGEDGGAGEIGGESGFGEESMGWEAVGIGVKDMFGGDEGVQGIGAESELAFGEEWGMAGGAEEAFDEAAFFSGAFELGGAEGFAAFIEGGFLAQDGIKDGDGVVKVFAMDCGEAFFVLVAERPRYRLKFLFGHEASLAEGEVSSIPKWRRLTR